MSIWAYFRASHSLCPPLASEVTISWYFISCPLCRSINLLCFSLNRLTNEDHEGNGLGASNGYEEVDGGVLGADVSLSGVAKSRFLDGLRDVVDLGIFS